jgi:hypothetical protein
LAKVVDNANGTPTGRRLIKNLQAKIKEALQPPNVQEEQRVREQEQRVMREQEQRVIDDTPILTIPCITNAPAIIQSRNPTAKWALKTTPRIHQRDTRNNTPRALPLITKRRRDRDNDAQGHRRLPRIKAKLALSTPFTTPSPTKITPIPCGARQRVVTQQAINVLTIQEKVSTNRAFTPTALMEFTVTHRPTKLEYYANPMVHPVTVETISSYKKLMNDPATAEVWQMAFGKDFGGMAQGNNKTGQKRTNAMFVMTHDEIAQALRARKVFTYTNPVVDHRPKRRPQPHTNHS